MSDRLEERLIRLGAATEYPPTPDVSARILRQLRSARRPAPLPRALGWSVAILLLVFSALLAVPPARAAVLEFIQIGIVRIFGGPSNEVRPTNGPPVTATPGAPPPTDATGPASADLPTYLKQLAGVTTLEAASRAVDFPIRLPAYPESLGEPDWVFLQDAHGDLLVLVWMDAEFQNVEISLHMIEAGSWAIEKTEPRVIRETQVNGQRAVWTEGEYPLLLRRGDIEFTRLVEGHVLIWAVGDITYRLETSMPLEEALRVAESLHPLGDTAPDS